MKRFVWLGISIMIMTGCASSAKRTTPSSPGGLERIAQELGKDKEAQSAVENVTTAVSRNSVAVKYCPVDGRRFSANLKRCPEHNVELKPVE